MLARTSPVSTAHDTLAPSHDVVFVDVDLGARVCSASGVEGDLDVVRAQGIVEDVATPGTIIVASLL